MLYIVNNDNLFLLECLATNCYKDSQTLVCNFKVVNPKFPYIFVLWRTMICLGEINENSS